MIRRRGHISVGILSVLIVVLMVATTATSRVRPGFKVGLSSSTFSENSIVGWSWRNDISGGFMLDVSIAQGWSIVPQFVVATKGGRHYSIGDHYYASGNRTTYNLVFLEFPMMIRHTFQVEGSVRPYLLGGYSMGVAVDGCYTDLSTYSYDYYVDRNRRYTHNFSKAPIPVDHGPVIGVGVDFRTQRGDLLMECTYSIGLQSYRGYEDVRRRTRTVLLAVGYSFGCSEGSR